jgi:hypothetical protein
MAPRRDCLSQISHIDLHWGLLAFGVRCDGTSFLVVAVRANELLPIPVGNCDEHEDRAGRNGDLCARREVGDKRPTVFGPALSHVRLCHTAHPISVSRPPLLPANTLQS